MKFASTLPLPDDAELAVVYCGQSNARPWGCIEDAETEDSRVRLSTPGVDITIDNDFALASEQSRYALQPGLTTAVLINTTTKLGLYSVDFLGDQWNGARICLGLSSEAGGIGLRTGVVNTTRPAGTLAGATPVTPVPASNSFTWVDNRLVPGAPITAVPGGGNELTAATYFAEIVDDDTFKVHLTNARASGGTHQAPVATAVGTNVTMVCAVVTGTATGGTATTLVDTGAAWTNNEHRGRRVRITGGTGVDPYEVLILANTATTLTVAGWRNGTPDATSGYSIEWRADELVGCEIEFAVLNSLPTTPGVEKAVITGNTASSITFAPAVSVATAVGDVAVIWGIPEEETFATVGTCSFYVAHNYLGVTWSAGSTITHGDEAVTSRATGWLVMPNEKWKTFKTAGVLTMFTPEVAGPNPTDPPVLPGGFTVQPEWTTWDQVGLFLDFTFYEGIEGPGFYHAGIAAATALPTSTKIETTGLTPNEWVDSHIRVKAYADGVLKQIRYGTVTANTATVLTVAGGWTGGTPGAGLTGVLTYDIEVFMPHYENNPHALTAGEGFRRPLNDSQPFGGATPANGGKLHLRHKDVTTYGYHRHLLQGYNRFGAHLPTLYQLSAHLGRKVHMIHLGINSAGIYEQVARNAFGCQTSVGWWDPDLFLDWHAGRSDGSFARLKTMIVNSPRALKAAGSSKKLYVIGIVYYQGEAESLDPVTSTRYRKTLPSFARALRKVIHDAGLNLYDSPDKIPFVQPKLPSDPWELDSAAIQAIYGLPNQPDGDVDGNVNAAILDFTSGDPYAGTIETEGRSKLGDNNQLNGIDPLHFDGVAEVQNGHDVADELATLIDKAWSTIVPATDAAVLDIVNEALAMAGELEQSVTDLDATTLVSTLGKKFYRESKRALLERYCFSFASERAVLQPMSDRIRRVEWDYAYGLPANYARVFAVAPEGTSDDEMSANAPIRWPFKVERDPELGFQVLYTDVGDAVARYTLTTANVEAFSPNLRTALVWHIASKFTGALVKGDAGRKGAREMLSMAEAYLRAAAQIDAASQKSNVSDDHRAPWHRETNR